MQAYDLSRLTVLIVEKHAPMRALLGRVLRALGVRAVLRAGDPARAIRLFKEARPDLVLCDWGPGFDGLGLVRAIRADEAATGPRAAVIMVTAFEEAAHAGEALDAGMTEYLTKPISAGLLYQRLVAVIENKRPFVRAGGFVGPDRRRRDVPHDGERRERTNAPPRADAA